MANDRTQSAYRAVLWHDERISASNLKAKGAGATDSSYTQADPTPGVPESDSLLSVYASGGQGEDGSLELSCVRAGSAGADGASFVLRDVEAAETTSQWSGSDSVLALTDWEAVFSSTGTTAKSQSRPHAITLNSGKVLAAVDFLTGTSSLRLYRYDPADSTWTSLPETLTHNGDQAGPALCELPNGDVLLFTEARNGKQVDVWRSEDEGSSWESVATRVLAVPVEVADIQQIRAAYNGGHVALFVVYHHGSDAANINRVWQYASSDRGATFDSVQTIAHPLTSESAWTIDVLAMRGGGFLLGKGGKNFSDHGSNRIPSAYASTMDATDISFGGTATNADEGAIALIETDSGEIVAFCHDSAAGSGDITVFSSEDRGDSWTQRGTVLNLEAIADGELYHYTAARVGGRVGLVGKFAGAGSYADHTTVCAWVGGYSRHTLPAADDADDFGRWDFLAWGTNSSDVPAWVPVNTPDVMTGWSAAAGGGATVTLKADNMEIDSTANSESYDYEWDATVETVAAEVVMDPSVGGALTNASMAFRLYNSDGTSGGAGTYTYAIEVRFDTSNFRVWDLNAGAQVGADIAHARAKQHVRVMLDDSGNVRVWSGLPGYRRTFAIKVTGSGLTNTAAAQGNKVEFGNIASGTATSNWYGVWVSRAGTGWYVPDASGTPAAAWTNPDDLRGRPLTTGAQLLMDGVRVRGAAGPAYLGDEVTIKADHVYPLRSVFPDERPSPRRFWKSSADGVEYSFVFDPKEAGSTFRWESNLIGAMVYGSNIREFYVEGHDGATWTTIVQALAYEDYDGLEATRTDSVVMVDTGTAHKGAKYIYREAHVGDTLEFTTAPKVRRVEHNTEGSFTDETTHRPRFVLKGIDDSEAAGDTVRIWRKDFGALAVDSTAYQLIRFRIPAHSTVDGFYKIGTLVMGPVAVFGQTPDSGFGITHDFAARVSERPDRILHAAGVAPARRMAEIAWANEGLDLHTVQAADPVADYVTIDGSEPVATFGDQARQMVGIIKRAKGEVTPFAYLASVPKIGGGASTLRLTDSSTFMLCRAQADPRIDHVLGEEGQGEMERLNPVTLIEVV